MPTVSGMRCRVCGIGAEIYVANEEEECSLAVDDPSYVCDGCQEVIDRAGSQMGADEEETEFVEGVLEFVKTQVERGHEEGIHKDWLDLLKARAE